MVIGLDHEVMLMNRAVRERYGRPGAMMPSTCYGLSHDREEPCGEPGVDCPLRRVRETLSPTTVTHTHREANGDTRFIEVVAAPLLDPQGQLVGIIESCRDITERRRFEEELFRGRRLKSIGVLAGGIAHDFNNLLAVIQANVEYLGHSVAGRTAEGHEVIADVATACARARDLTQQLLTFSEGGSPIKRVLRLPEVAAPAVKLATTGSSCTSELDFAADLWPLEADAGQLHQLVQNLVLNAVQAMPEGGRLSVRAVNFRPATATLHNIMADAPYIKLTVRDDGPGIPEELRDRVFDPYVTTRSDGNGLGLPTAFSIARNHGGLLRLDPDYRDGAGFEVLLPAVPGGVVTPIETPQAKSPGLSGQILVMDDEPAICRLVARILARRGLEVVSAVDGEEALQRYREQLQAGAPFDAVILDLTVPDGMGGLETLTRIRELDPAVRAIVSSGYSTDPIMANYAEHGFAGVVSKPYSPADLADAVASVLRG